MNLHKVESSLRPSHSPRRSLSSSTSSLQQADSLLWEESLASDSRTSNRWSLRRIAGLLVTGAGMFIAAFFLITTGQLKTVWEAAYPTCWLGANGNSVNCPDKIKCPGLFPECSTAPCGGYQPGYCTGADGGYPASQVCSKSVLVATSGVVFGGVMLGMLFFGAVGDRMGRRFGGIATMAVMATGAAVMTFVYSPSISDMFIVISSFFGVLGLGVGGEYPIAASNAAEKRNEEAEGEASAAVANGSNGQTRSSESTPPISGKTPSPPLSTTLASQRGRTVTVVFSMQGIGIVFGSLIVVIAVAAARQITPNCSNSSNDEMGFSTIALSFAWRAVYLVGFLWLAAVLTYRVLFSRENEAYVKAAARRAERQRRQQTPAASQLSGYAPIFRHYGSRLIGTGVTWCMNDVILYGNKLYSGPIFNGINRNENLLTQNACILLNNAVSLVGYYVAAAVIDRRWCGRRRLQLFGFIMIAVFFAMLAGTYDRLASSNHGALIALYILASFFSQVGPNVVTYVSAAELYPSEIRARAHGFSAFCGKAGALVSTLVFGAIGIRNIFIVSAAAGAFGALITAIFLPDVTGMCLREHDREWELVTGGRRREYGGEAANPRHLSMCERWLGRGKAYRPDWLRVHREKRRREERLARISGSEGKQEAAM
ncbi:hypothetical protein CDCA_CDCA07G2213 [Cyanidium caldarium]|uniref:Major facilitator superfamily (MFS) profile domain-containing protein n=1 Tax=Cyanidium caldarium TaxID=2771 RepID=A0AAV9IV70_CYACA|nr:hypothetical protein CDCA_CDCA07G2213 [Cyanidium caldarium]